MTPSEKDVWDDWLADRREVQPTENLTDQIMSQVVELDQQRREVWSASLINKIDRSRFGRIAVCAAALVVGGLPFLFLAYVAKFI